MKTKIMNILGCLGLLALAACSSQKPQTMSASVVTSNVISPGSNFDFVQNVGDSVYFPFDKSALSAEAKMTLTSQAKWLNDYKQYNIEVVGHCDARGTVEYNLALGQRRAAAAKNFLVSQGVDAHRITTTSAGKSFPLCVGEDERSLAMNRVAVSLLLQDGKPIEVPAGISVPVALIKDGKVMATEKTEISAPSA